VLIGSLVHTTWGQGSNEEKIRLQSVSVSLTLAVLQHFLSSGVCGLGEKRHHADVRVIATSDMGEDSPLKGVVHFKKKQQKNFC